VSATVLMGRGKGRFVVRDSSPVRLEEVGGGGWHGGESGEGGGGGVIRRPRLWSDCGRTHVAPSQWGHPATCVHFLFGASVVQRRILERMGTLK
jgi:hypothetical protein